MWKMLDDIIECSECGGSLGPPPKFVIPPPPRPPSIAAYDTSSSCNGEDMALKAQNTWENDMCEAIPILDASLYSSQSLQTSAMIAVFSLLLILVVLISSLFLWKNKRKVQNLLPCKTPTRNAHITGALSALASGHTVTYEDPEAHLGHHRPLVMRHHRNVEMLHSKSIHYPSGYPMTRSPPFLVSNSPGPDPYRSNDNVYEELGPIRDSDVESEPPVHSDDDFAEDELSLPGENSFNKPTDTSTSDNTVPPACSERTDGNVASNSNGPERHSVLSSASSSQDASTATVVSSNSSHNNNSNTNNGNIGATSTTHRSGTAATLSGIMRHSAGRKTANGSRLRNDRKGVQVESFSTSASTADMACFKPIQKLYDNSSNLIALRYHQHQQQPNAINYPHSQSYHHSLHHHDSNRNPSTNPVHHFYNTIETEVERRNRINSQLKNSSSPAVSTIFRERIQYPSSVRYPQYFYATSAQNSILAPSLTAKTNLRSIDRRRGRVAAPLDPIEPAYGYTEPVYHHNYHYESCEAQDGIQQRVPQPITMYPTCIMPEYSSGSIVSFKQHHHAHHPASQTYQNSTSLYAHGDSSFGSDSGYSHNTPASSIGRHDYDIAMPIPPAPPAPTQKPPSKLANALTFSWHKKKSTNTNCMSMQPNTNKPPALSTPSTTEASSPNNNSASSTITSTIENNSSSSSVGPQSQNNNELIHA